MRGVRIAGMFAMVMSGCTGSAEDAGEVTSALEAGGMTIQTYALVPADGSATAMWGELIAFGGSIYPPNPFGDTFEDATLAVFGVLHNLDGETLTAASIVAITDGGRVVLELASPPDACRTYRIDAIAAVDWGGVNPGPPDLVMSFSSALGDLVAVPTGPGQRLDPYARNPGPPNEPAADEPVCPLSYGTRL